MEGTTAPPAQATAPTAGRKSKSSSSSASASTSSSGISSTGSAAGGTSAVDSISRVQRALRSSGVDPLAYVLHCGRLQETGSGHDDIYRLQHFTGPACGDVGVGDGKTVVVCQLLGTLQSDAAQLEAAKGYDPIAAKAAAKAEAAAGGGGGGQEDGGGGASMDVEK